MTTAMAAKRRIVIAEDEDVEHRHFYVEGFDLFAEVFGRAADHQPGDEDGEDDEDKHAVKPGADAAEDDFAEHDVEQRDRAAERREASRAWS